VSDLKKWRGLNALVVDAVVQASRAIERVQKETANRPFGILEQIPPIALPARGVHVIFDASVAGVHGAIRLVSRAGGGTVDVAFEVADKNAVASAGVSEASPPVPTSPSDPESPESARESSPRSDRSSTRSSAP
jgi:hypothetical protein